MNKQNVFKKKSNIRYYIIAFVASVFFGLVITLGISLCFGYKYRIISTDSMEPKVHVGTLIIENKVSFDSLQVGDIITYTRPNEKNIKVTHRIIDINEDGTLVVKGDNPDHSQIDEVNANNYVGKALILVPNIREFFDWIYANMFLLLYDLLVIVITYQILFL